DPCIDIAILHLRRTCAGSRESPVTVVCLPRVSPEWRVGIRCLAHPLPAIAHRAAGIVDLADSLAHSAEPHGGDVQPASLEQVDTGDFVLGKRYPRVGDATIAVID